MVVVSVTLPEDLLERFDEFMKTRGYYSRSEAFRDAIRGLIAEADLTKIDSGDVVTTIMVTCEYARKDVDLRLSEVRHEYDDVVVENMHRHILDRYCFEVL